MRILLSLAILVILALPVQAGFIQEAQIVADDIQSYISVSNDTVLVKGKYTSTPEKLVLEYLQDNYPDIAAVHAIEESEVTSLDHETVVLLGGPYQNTYSGFVSNNYKLIKNYSIALGDIRVYSEHGKNFIVFSDRAGYGNLPQTAVEKSPLAKFIPLSAVPLTASLIGLFLLWLWKFLAQILLKIFRFKAASKVMEKIKKKELQKKFKGFHIKGIRIKYREWISIFLAATVFAIAASYLYIFKQHMITFVLVNVIVNAFIYTVRHGVRLVMDNTHGIHTEYVFWYWGAIITVFSGWLGNTFGLAGYMVSDADKKEKKEGPIAFTINMITFVLFIILAVWNTLAPGTAVQMAMMLSISLTFLFMLPMKPFAGRFIFAWKRWVWIVSFVPITVFYVAVNLIV